MSVATHTGVPVRLSLHSCHQLLDLGLNCTDRYIVLQCGSDVVSLI